MLTNNRQFIFVTHNANFPVLGDAEIVAACAYEVRPQSVERVAIERIVHFVRDRQYPGQGSDGTKRTPDPTT